jgi:hypothetical protein
MRAGRLSSETMPNPARRSCATNLPQYRRHNILAFSECVTCEARGCCRHVECLAGLMYDVPRSTEFLHLDIQILVSAATRCVGSLAAVCETPPANPPETSRLPGGREAKLVVIPSSSPNASNGPTHQTAARADAAASNRSCREGGGGIWKASSRPPHWFGHGSF